MLLINNWLNLGWIKYILQDAECEAMVFFIPHGQMLARFLIIILIFNLIQFLILKKCHPQAK